MTSTVSQLVSGISCLCLPSAEMSGLPRPPDSYLGVVAQVYMPDALTSEPSSQLIEYFFSGNITV